VALGRETSRASGSSLGAVLATGLGAAGRSVRGRTSLDRDGVVTAIAAAVHKIGERSGATAGAKTVLDSLLRMDRDARGAQAYGLDAAIASCRAVLDEFRDRVATIGRARMYGDGSRGHDDPGMLAALLILRAARG
jgi:dihydroxyacetone kinase-like protein